jgi:hypothetical protein
MSYIAVPTLFACLSLLITFPHSLQAQESAPPTVSSGPKLYVAPMDWNLDRFVTAEIERQGLPVQVVAHPEGADFVMTADYQSLGSHFLTPGHYIRARMLSADGRRQVWSGDANDYGIFFGRMRHHGPSRAARTIVRGLRHRMSSMAPAGQ